MRRRHGGIHKKRIKVWFWESWRIYSFWGLIIISSAKRRYIEAQTKKARINSIELDSIPLSTRERKYHCSLARKYWSYPKPKILKIRTPTGKNTVRIQFTHSQDTHRAIDCFILLNEQIWWYWRHISY